VQQITHAAYWRRARASVGNPVCAVGRRLVSLRPWVVGWVVLALLLWLAPAVAADRVRVQLKWDHEFQFAGFYAADWKGYYAEAGLEVELRSRLRPDGSLVDVAAAVAAGEAEYGLGSTDILLAVDRGAKLQVLGTLIQRNPDALFALDPIPLRSLADLAGRRIRVSGELARAKLLLAFQQAGLPPPADLAVATDPLTLTDLVAGVAEVIDHYEISALWEARQLGVSYQMIPFSRLGLDFPGDTLFVNGDYARAHSELVQRFWAATLRGWAYALQHPDEIATRISRELPRVLRYSDPLAYNRMEAEWMEQVMLWPSVPLGQVQPERWQTLHALLAQAGLVTGPWPGETLFFATPQPWSALTARWVGWLALGAGILLLLAWSLWRRRPGWTAVAMVWLALGAAGLVGERELVALAGQRVDPLLERELAILARSIEADIEHDITTLRALGMAFSQAPEALQPHFPELAAQVLERVRLGRILVLAPDLVVQQIWPRSGNEAVLGLDFRSDAQQSEAALRAVAAGDVVLAGPLALRQGGRGLVARLPVFTDPALRRAGTPVEARLHGVWGLLNLVLEIEPVLTRLELTRTLGGVPVQLGLRGVDGTGPLGAIIFGDEALFAAADATVEVALPQGSWQLAARVLGVPPVPGLAALRLMLLTLAAVAALAILGMARGQKRRLLALRAEMASVRHCQALLEASDVPCLRVVEGRIVAVSPALQSWLGKEPVVGWPLTRLLPGLPPLTPGARAEALLPQRSPWPQWRPVQVCAYAGPALGGDPGLTLRLEPVLDPRPECQAVSALEQLTEAVAVLGPDRRVRWVNAAMTRLLGVSRDSLLAMPLPLLRPEAMHESLAAQLAAAMQESGQWSGMIPLKCGGEPRPVRMKLAAQPLGEAALITHYTVVLTEVAGHDSDLPHRGQSDPGAGLTGLPGRQLTVDTLTRELARQQRDHTAMALFYVLPEGLDGIEDRLGAAVRDHVLRQIADRLRRRVRGGDLAGQVGHEEFVLLLHKPPSRLDVVQVAGRLQHDLRLDVPGVPPGGVSTSLGVVWLGLPVERWRGVEAVALLERAREAAMQARRDGGQRFAFAEAPSIS